MSKRPLTPSEVAVKVRQTKVSLSLNKQNIDLLKNFALRENIPLSNLVDEAIASYLETIQEKKEKK